jgi:DNA-binding MarR family transcriptional regulator
MGKAPRGGDNYDELPDEVLVRLYSNLFFLLRRSDQRAVSLFNQTAKGLEITLPQLHVLYIATQVGALSQGEIARQVAADEATTSLVVGTLVKKGWLERTPDLHDRRKKVVNATAAGRAHFEQLLVLFREAFGILEAPLGDRLGRLIHLLATVVDRGGGKISGPEGLGPEASRKLTIVHRSMQFLVRRTIQLIEQRCAPYLAESGITIRQYVVLLLIGLRSDIGEVRIATTIGLELSNTSFIARGLAAKALVTVDESGRRRRYRATGEGLALIRELEPKIYDASASFLALLGPEEQVELMRGLSEVVLGDGASGPPALARIVRRPDWPALKSPLAATATKAVKDEAHGQRTLNELLCEVVAEMETNSKALSSLNSKEQEQLRVLFGKVLENAAGPTSAFKNSKR